MNDKKRQTNQLQARYLRDRVRAAFSTHRSNIFARSTEKEPPSVAAARKLIQDFEKKRRLAEQKVQDGAMRRLREAKDRVEEALLFAAPEAALKAVQDFERRKIA